MRTNRIHLIAVGLAATVWPVATSTAAADSQHAAGSAQADSKIAFVSSRDCCGPGDGEIYVVNADGSGRLRLTRNATDSPPATPAWSPDGRKILFVGAGINVVNADGSWLRRLAPYAWAPAWSPAGRKIAFKSGTAANTGAIYTMNADGSGQRRLMRTATGWVSGRSCLVA